MRGYFCEQERTKLDNPLERCFLLVKRTTFRIETGFPFSDSTMSHIAAHKAIRGRTTKFALAL